MSRFVGFRLRAKGKDKDIEDDLKRFSDESERIREAYRLAMEVERGEYVRVSALQNVAPAAPVVRPAPRREPGNPVVWEPAVKAVELSEDDIRKNILSDF